MQKHLLHHIASVYDESLLIEKGDIHKSSYQEYFVIPLFGFYRKGVRKIYRHVSSILL